MHHFFSILFFHFIVCYCSFTSLYKKTTKKSEANFPNTNFVYQKSQLVQKNIINLGYPGPIWSGYIPVDDVGSMIFYHLYPANGCFDPMSTLNNSFPLILWLQGGPGCSDWVGALHENGPFTIINQNSSQMTWLTKDNWNKGYNLLFVDQPAGVGFSTIGPGVKVTNSIQAAQYMKIFLDSFFNIYSSLIENDFYIFGESFAGHFIPALAVLMIQNNSYKVTGIGIGDGLVNPFYHAISWGPYAYSVGLIDPESQGFINSLGLLAQNNYTKGDFNNVNDIFNEILSYIGNISMTGISNIDDYRSEGSEPFPYENWMTQISMRNAYGIDPSVEYADCDATIGSEFSDIGESYASNITYLLNNNVRVLIYQGQDDLLINTYGTRLWMENLNWTGIIGWLNATTKVLASPSTNQTFGTIKSTAQLSFAMIYDAGHMVPAYQPYASKLMIDAFINNSTI